MSAPGGKPSDSNNAPPVVVATSAVDEEEYTIVHTGGVVRKGLTKKVAIDDEEPLVDTTAAIPLNSKKTKRLQKQLLKKEKKTKVTSETKSFLELPPELLQEVLGHLKPSDIATLLRLNRATRDFILDNERSISRDVIRRRYWILGKCFPLPYHLAQVDEETCAALLNTRRQELLNIHKKPYQHIKPVNPLVVCTCTTCVLAWNNLCLLLDFAHFQTHLNAREPIPMIPRGTSPQWNQVLTEDNAAVVKKAMSSPLCYAGILEKHLATTIGTLLRQSRLRLPPKRVVNHSAPAGFKDNRSKTLHPKRLYHLTDGDAASETDAFLARNGPPSYEFPYHRDNYYSLQAYLPNRKWNKEQERWGYYDGTQHEKDLIWAKQWFAPSEAPASLPQKEIDRARAGAERIATTGLNTISSPIETQGTEVLPIR